jgi:NADPH-dependent glutamate synthase beta subunit-like oxidoreductase/ferredoxin/NAD-dependent dihydropyrimidine dehydrogenase PreA subunit
LATIKLNIDGREVETEPGKTVLEAALDAGIYIPHLCHHPDLPSVGACRLCLVEIEGRPGLTTSCTTLAAEAMVVQTKTPRVNKIRSLAMELMLAQHPADCESCPKYLNCELQSLKQYIGITEGNRFKKRPAPAANASNPLFLHDLSRCVLCGRCVRACSELRGAGVLSFINRGREMRIGTAFDHPLADAGCRFCGACAEVCPTGALRDKEELIKAGQGRRVSLIPCKYTCPAGIDVPRYIRFIREKRYPEALAVIREKVPFPAVLGYVCHHPCETVCRRGELNEAIAIRELKRFAAENDSRLWEKNSRKAPPTGKRVAIIGSGPAGLTAAFYLSRLGHSVTVFEAMALPGGMLRVGIPEYRLPREVLDAEIKEIENAGVEIRTKTKIASLEALREEGYQAILVALGTHQGQKLAIPGADLDGILVGIDFLRDVNLGRGAEVGKRVLVLGGGNVAFDCARTALRLGATETAIACLEARDHMLATPEEIAEGLEEGITIHNSQTFTRIAGENGRVSGVACLDVVSFEFDDEGNLSMETAEGSEHMLSADTVIFAIGQRPEIPAGFGLDTGQGNTIQVDEYTHATSQDGIFAAGDAVTGTTSVIEAIASGRNMASAIDSYLGGSGIIDEELAPVEKPEAWLGRDEEFAGRHRREIPSRPVAPRLGGFGEVAPGYDEEAALAESQRCLQCDLRFKISPVRFWADYTPQ